MSADFRAEKRGKLEDWLHVSSMPCSTGGTFVCLDCTVEATETMPRHGFLITLTREEAKQLAAKLTVEAGLSGVGDVIEFVGWMAEVSRKARER